MASAPAPHLPESIPRPEQALNILVVDDNSDAAESIGLLLETIGYEVHIEHGTKRALERTGNLKPKVYLLDIGLPEINGHELARQIRQQHGMKN